MWDRIRYDGTATDLTRDRFGFLEFVEELGPIPVRMLHPTIGRVDHSRGYESGNYIWQEFLENCVENGTRNKVTTRPEVRAKNSFVRHKQETAKMHYFPPV